MNREWKWRLSVYGEDHIVIRDGWDREDRGRLVLLALYTAAAEVHFGMPLPKERAASHAPLHMGGVDDAVLRMAEEYELVVPAQIIPAQLASFSLGNITVEEGLRMGCCLQVQGKGSGSVVARAAELVHATLSHPSRSATT